MVMRTPCSTVVGLPFGCFVIALVVGISAEGDQLEPAAEVGVVREIPGGAGLAEFVGALLGIGDERLCSLDGLEGGFFGAFLGVEFGLDAAGEEGVDILNRVFGGVEDPPATAHGADGGAVEISDPVVFAEAAGIVGVRGVVGELPLIEEEDEEGAAALIGEWVCEFAKAGGCGELLAELELDGVHAFERAAAGLVVGFADGVPHEDDGPVRGVGIEPGFEFGEAGCGDAEVAFDIKVLGLFPAGDEVGGGADLER